MSRERHRWDPTCEPPRGLVRPVRLDAAGATGPTKAQAAGPHWRQTTRGFYVPVLVDDAQPEQRVLEQAARLPTGGAVTGWASCRLHGAAFFDGLATDGVTRLPVPLAIGDLGQLRETVEASVSRERLDPGEVTRLHGIPCTVRRRALFDAMRTAPDVREAVVAMDMMAAAELVSVSQMLAYVAAHPGWRGVGQVRRALPLESEQSRSPNETRMRLVWQLDAGLARPLVNEPVFTLGGTLLGYADLFDPDAGVVGEYDGAEHRFAKRHSRDVAREDGFRGAGLEYFTITGPDMDDRPLMVRRMHTTRARARWLPETRRRWTLLPPPWWPAPRTLDQELERRTVLAEVYEEQERLAAGM